MRQPKSGTGIVLADTARIAVAPSAVLLPKRGEHTISMRTHFGIDRLVIIIRIDMVLGLL